MTGNTENCEIADTEKTFLVEKESRCGHTGTEGKIKNKNTRSVEENTGDEKGLSTSLWSFTVSSHPQLRLLLLLLWAKIG